MNYEAEIKEVRDWLMTMKGRWPDVAKKARISTRAISYIVTHDERTPHPATLTAIKTARKAIEREDERAAQV